MPLALYQGLNLIPGMGAEAFNTDTDVADILYGSPHLHVLLNYARVDGAARDAGNSPTTILRTGLVMGQVTATGKWKQWTSGAVDGSQVARGILLAFGVNTQYDDADADRFLATILVAGYVNPEALCIGSSASYGLARTGEGLEVRTSLLHNIKFSDDFVCDLADPVSGR